jgi:hypothetical protein
MEDDKTSHVCIKHRINGLYLSIKHALFACSISVRYLESGWS